MEQLSIFDEIKPKEKTDSGNKKLFAHVYESCNILRGPIGQDEFKSYVMPILFFKRLSDVYDEEASAGQEHRFQIPDGCHWSDLESVEINIGTAIKTAMMGIEQANPEKLAGIFSDFDEADWTGFPDDRLFNLVKHMSRMNLSNSNYSADAMGDAYEYLLQKFADVSMKNAGEFYTPRAVVELMVRMLSPKTGESIYDPACGTGGMLIESIRQATKAYGRGGSVFGQEKNLTTSAIARMNLFLHGAEESFVVQGDTLLEPKNATENCLHTFDCVIANPPFSLKNWGANEFENDVYGRNIWGNPGDNCADYAWLQHMVCSMDSSHGRCAVVLPQGVLFHGGKEGTIRKELIESDKLECVISLASGIFLSTGVSACILLLNNNKPENHRNRVQLIDATRIYTHLRAQNIISEENVNEIWDLFSNYANVVGKSCVASLDRIRENGYMLSPSSYIEREQVEQVDPAKVRERYFEALQEVTLAEEKIKRILSEGDILYG